MRVLITGGSGFLGKRLTKRLKGSHHDVWTYDNLDKLCGGDIYPNFPYSILDRSSLERVVKSCNITHISHLAAYGRNLTCKDHPQMAHQVNVLGTRYVLGLMETFKNLRVVCCSSNITLSHVATVYKDTKLTNEQDVEFFAEEGYNCMALRPSNMHGPGQSRTEYQPCAFAGMDIGFQRDGHFTITGDGTQTRDFVHADDVARAFELALMSDYTGKTLDVCSGVQTSMNEVAKLLDVPVVYGPERPGDAKSLESNPDPAFKALLFHASLKLNQTIMESFPSVKASHTHQLVQS